MYFVKMELISSQLDDVVFLTAKICLLVFHLDAFQFIEKGEKKKRSLVKKVLKYELSAIIL